MIIYKLLNSPILSVVDWICVCYIDWVIYGYIKYTLQATCYHVSPNMVT